MTYRELFYKATRLIDKGDITLGEYEEMTKPLDREIEQEPVLGKVRAEIEKLQTYKMFVGEDTVYIERDDVLAIIDKYKGESEGTDAGSN
jgi:hypothetical protein